MTVCQPCFFKVYERIRFVLSTIIRCNFMHNGPYICVNYKKKIKKTHILNIFVVPGAVFLIFLTCGVYASTCVDNDDCSAAGETCCDDNKCSRDCGWPMWVPAGVTIQMTDIQMTDKWKYSGWKLGLLRNSAKPNEEVQP